MISFSIPGEPVAKARPRVTKTGHAYTPEKTVNYENLVRLMYSNKYHGMSFPAKVPLTMEIKVFMGIPQSTSKKRAADMMKCKERPTKKPDVDNIIKIVMDALNGVAYPDDKQVVSIVCNKYYNATPRVEVQIEEASGW